MQTELLNEVRRLKASYSKHGQCTGSKYALDAARSTLKYPSVEVEWADGYGFPEGIVHHDEFDIRVEVDCDPDPDLSWIGEFSNDWAPGAIEIEKDNGFNPTRHSYTYFIPATEYRNLDWRLMKQILRDEFIPVCVKVTASRNGIELGRAYLGGCFYDGNADQIAYDYLSDLVEEAVEEARAAIASLCPHCGK